MSYKKILLSLLFSFLLIAGIKDGDKDSFGSVEAGSVKDHREISKKEKLGQTNNNQKKLEEDEEALSKLRSKAIEELGGLKFLDGKSLIAYTSAIYSKKDPKEIENIIGQAKKANDKSRKEKEDAFMIDLHYQKAKVVKIVDGDTLVVDLKAKTYKLRMIGIDTPETKHPYKDVEFFGLEASRFTKENLDNVEVYLEKDVSEIDRYQRLLRYVWLKLPKDPENPSYEEIKNQSFNGILLKEGYAKASTFPPDVKYSEYFYKIEKEARDESRGLWNEGLRKAFEEKKLTGSDKLGTGKKKGKWLQTAKKITRGNRTYLADTTDGPIKANKKSGKYHVRGQKGYNKISVDNVEWFDSEEEAEKAGYVKAKR